MPMSPAALGVVLREVVAPQPRALTASSICRSPAACRAATMRFRRPAPRRAIVVTARNLDLAGAEKMAADGIAVITVPENRWARVDIKSVSLLPNVLAKQAAREQGAREAWFVDADGCVTEGASSNAWIVTRDGKVVTRPADHGILRGHHPHGGARGDRGAGAQARGARLHARGGLRRARGLRHLGEPDRAAGGAASTAARSATARPGLIATALRRDFHRLRRNRPERCSSCASDCPESTRFCAVAPPTWACTSNGVPSNVLPQVRWPIITWPAT